MMEPIRVKELPAEEKTYSRDELNDILNEKRKEWEEERLANLSKDEQISQLKKELFKANMKDQINNRLTEEGHPRKGCGADPVYR